MSSANSLLISVDVNRLTGELTTLAGITEAGPPVVTRVVFSEADLRAREWVKGLCREAGLMIREDAVGNTFVRWEGSEPGLAAVGTGSHIDAIPNAGAYDGAVGVLGGLEAIRALQRVGYRPRRAIELVIFTSEEPTRFGIGCLGSRLMGGVLSAEQALALRDKDGHGLEELRSAAGFAGPLGWVKLAEGHYSAFVELHIEQGPILEREGIDIGVVTHIAAPASLRVVIEGEGGHAGAMLMPVRHDAFCAASELVLALEAAAKATGVIDTVGTVGVCEVFPGAVNSVPSRVRLETDIRDIDGARRDGVIASLKTAAEEIAERRGVRIGFETVNADPPATCEPAIVEAIERAAKVAGRSSQRMVSRAYHDSLFVARFAPVAMIFIPCRGGVSHRPDEYASPEWIAGGVEVLARTLAELASQ
ncbi:M20 family metallo-hydrolase [Acidicapsa dinghuensis]|uniref:M20 family metallo-hydrolase n=1 Tax=Acidicapsa dinghuensis TaxID=2218256 RepID=A0ABW1EGS0_9BACT|nr:M20 family metallo-hydrolase [Acidicapsa dinghuensis]